MEQQQEQQEQEQEQEQGQEQEQEQGQEQEQEQEHGQDGGASPQRLELGSDIFVGFDKMAQAYGVPETERNAAKAMVFYAGQSRPMLFPKEVAVCMDGAVVLPAAKANFYVEHPDITNLSDWPEFPRTWKACGELLSKVPGSADGLYLAGWQALAGGGLVLQLASSAEVALRLQQQNPDMCARPGRGARRMVLHSREIVVPPSAAARILHAVKGPSAAELELKEQCGPELAGIDGVERARRWYGQRLLVEQSAGRGNGVVLRVAALHEGSPLCEYDNVYMAFHKDLQEWAIDPLDGIPDEAFEDVTCAVGVDCARERPRITLSLDFHCDAALLAHAGAAPMDEEEDGDGGPASDEANQDEGGSAAATATVAGDQALGMAVGMAVADGPHQFHKLVPQGVTSILLSVAGDSRDTCLQLEPNGVVVAWRREQADRVVKADLANVTDAHLAVSAPVEAGGPLPIAYAMRQVRVSQAYFKLAPVPAADTAETRAARHAALGGYVPLPLDSAQAGVLRGEDLSTAYAELGLVMQQEHGRRGQATDRVRPVLRVQSTSTGIFASFDLAELLKSPAVASVLGMRRLVDAAGAVPVRGEEDTAATLAPVSLADVLSPSCFGNATKAQLRDAGWGSCSAAFNRCVEALMGALIHHVSPDAKRGREPRAGGSRGVKAVRATDDDE